MQNRDVIERLLEEQKTEREHQLDFIRGLRHTYAELNKQRWMPLDPLGHLINTWEQNLSTVETQINTFENILKSIQEGG